MGWVSILVCDGCLERVEPSEPVRYTDDGDKRDLADTALCRKWKKIKMTKHDYWLCPTCQLAMNTPDPGEL